MSLRDDLIEAGAKAFNGTYWNEETRGFVLSPQWRGDLEDMEMALDAMLAVLTERADEWADQANDDAGPPWISDRNIQSLLAVLREDAS